MQPQLSGDPRVARGEERGDLKRDSELEALNRVGLAPRQTLHRLLES